MANEMPSRWFVAQYKQNSHLIAKRNLENQGVNTFLPLVEITKRNNTKFLSKLKPLFPGYIFVSFNLEFFDWAKLNNTIGLGRLLVSNMTPETVPKNFIDNLKVRCDLNGLLLGEDKLKIGSKVEILKGPFASMIGSIERLEPQERVSLLFEIMGRKTRTTVSARDIEGVV